jgi:glycosyltransferase involved in cell wall biosynthesis
MKVAIVHDYLREYGGAERVLEEIHAMFPDAPLYTAYFNPEAMGRHGAKFKDWDIRTSWMQKVPFANKLISPFRIFAPLMFESFDLSGYDLVISSSSAVYFAKSVITKPETLHISYIHTPPRFLYGYTTSFNYKKNPVVKFFAEIVNHLLRFYDFEVSQRPDILVANSKNIQERIRKFYRRDSVVIYPPVDLEEFRRVENGGRGSEKYYLSLNRLVRGKGTEITVEACTKLGLPLKVAGSGPELERLKSIAGPTVEFLGNVSDEERVKLYEGAWAFIVASEDEDFGITPVEAQAAGTPVIAIRAGGYKETVVEDKTGVFFENASSEALIKVLEDFDSKKFKAEDCRKNAEKFSKESFRTRFLELIDKNVDKSKH